MQVWYIRLGRYSMQQKTLHIASHQPEVDTKLCIDTAVHFAVSNLTETLSQTLRTAELVGLNHPQIPITSSIFTQVAEEYA